MTDDEKNILDFLVRWNADALAWGNIYQTIDEHIAVLNTRLYCIQLIKEYRIKEKIQGAKKTATLKEINKINYNHLLYEHDPNKFYFPSQIGESVKGEKKYFNDKMALYFLKNLFFKKFNLPPLKTQKDIYNVRCYLLAIKKGFSLLPHITSQIPQIKSETEKKSATLTMHFIDKIMTMGMMSIFELAEEAERVIYKEEIERESQRTRRRSATQKALEEIKEHKSYPQIEKKIIKLNEAIKQENRKDEKEYRKQIFEKVSKIKKSTEKTKKRYTNLIINEFNTEKSIS